MPADVKQAMLNDPQAAESLAEEFSGTSVPEWYAKLPASVIDYYATITAPPTMVVDAVHSPVDDAISDVRSLENSVGSDLSAMSLSASSESVEASRWSKEASSNSKVASKHSDSQLAASASQLSLLAVTQSVDASSQSVYAASASRALFKDLDDEEVQATGVPSSAGAMNLALGSSVVGAVLTLVFALAL